MLWYVYALYNRSNHKIYIGQTGDLKRRIEEHNQKVGNHFTARVPGHWEVIYKEQLETKTEALRREKQLKSYRGRLFIKSYIPR